MHIDETTSLDLASKRLWDVVVVGAGTGGSVAAKKFAEKGLSVLLLDKKPLNEIGKKVCGDAIGVHHFKRTSIDPPKGEELDGLYSGIRVHSPDKETVYLVEGKGVSVNRYKFGQRLLKEALEKGVRLLSSARLIDVKIEGNFLSEAIVKHHSKNYRIKGKLFIDASGWLGAIRSKVADYMGVDKIFSKEDLSFCYREIRLLKEKYDGNRYCDIFLDLEVAPGGYWWAFPKRNGSILNIGLGVQMSLNYNPIERYRLVSKCNFLKESEILDKGVGIVPTRRPIDSLVWNGLMIIGDAASTVNPLHGGGIGHSMYSGILAADVGSNAINEGDVSLDRLWEFNVKYLRKDGARNAKLDVFRMFLQKISNNEINYGMKFRLIDERRLSTLEIEKVEEDTIKQKIEKVISALRKPTLLRKLLYVRKTMRKIVDLYENYPESPSDFVDWKMNVKSILNRFKSDLEK